VVRLNSVDREKNPEIEALKREIEELMNEERRIRVIRQRKEKVLRKIIQDIEIKKLDL
jgi:hypothetical protein